MSFFEAAILPDIQKRALCEELLNEFGARVRRINDSTGEMIHGCLVAPELHKDQDRNPTASLNYQKLTYNCLQGDTLVKTRGGEFPIRELAGGVHQLLDGEGRWVSAPVKEYGVDRLYRVTLSRNGVRKEIYATADHRWYIRPKGAYDQTSLVETTTLDLRPRQRIPSVWAMTRTGRTMVSPIGVMRGFVFGDGTVTEHGSVANFCGEKDQALLSWFPGFEIRPYDGIKKITRGLPRSWKLRLPDLDEGLSSLYGWLAGYFAADGCVADDGHVTLSCANRETLESVIAICDRLGIATYTLSGRTRQGKGDGESEIFSLSFRGSTLTPEFFLIPEHRRRYEEARQRRTYERTNWWVVSVEETDRVEPVYCAEVASTHSFVLADNVLTGNCLGCGSSGGLLWFIATCRGETSQVARQWLEQTAGLGGQVLELDAMLRFLDAIYAKPEKQPIPRYSDRMLEAWAYDHPYFEEGRGIGPVAREYFKLGWDPNTDRAVFPHFWQGELVGWQTRKMPPEWRSVEWTPRPPKKDGEEAFDIHSGHPKSPKYHSSPDFPKDSTIYNYDPKNHPTVVVVESMASVLRHFLNIHMSATFGAKVTDRQVKWLVKHDVTILWMDNDLAGWRAVEGRPAERPTKENPQGKEEILGLAAKLAPYTEVLIVDSPWQQDAGDLPVEAAKDLVASAVPWSLWSRPRVLYCFECKNKAHEGPCCR